MRIYMFEKFIGTKEKTYICSDAVHLSFYYHKTKKKYSINIYNDFLPTYEALVFCKALKDIKTPPYHQRTRL